MDESPSGNSQIAAAPSPRVSRHKVLDRLYHWLMAICIFTLMATAFLPILGIKFEWLDIHWITGVALAVLVIFHIVRAIGWQDWRNMWIGFADIRDLWRNVAQLLGARKNASPARQVRRRAKALPSRRCNRGFVGRR